MDPNANLDEQLNLVTEGIAYGEDTTPEDLIRDGEVGELLVSHLRLCDLVEALNEWIRKGGFLPEVWQRKPRQYKTNDGYLLTEQLAWGNDDMLFAADPATGLPIGYQNKVLAGALTETWGTPSGPMYTPWQDGPCVGLRCTVNGKTRYIYLNPSSEDSEGRPNVFLYDGPHGDPAQDTACMWVPSDTPEVPGV